MSRRSLGNSADGVGSGGADERIDQRSYYDLEREERNRRFEDKRRRDRQDQDEDRRTPGQRHGWNSW